VILCRASRALNGQSGIATDRCGKQLREHGLRCARFANEHEPLAAEKSDNRSVNERIISIELLAYVAPGVAKDEGADGAR
jgi:hypothetical protein